MTFAVGPVYVVATSRESTAAALCEASRLPHERIALLVPVPVGPTAGTDASERLTTFGAVATEVGVHAAPYALICRHPAEIFMWFPAGPEATIVVGPDAEALAATLRASGHHVLVAGSTSTSQAQASTPDVA